MRVSLNFDNFGTVVFEAVAETEAERNILSWLTEGDGHTFSLSPNYDHETVGVNQVRLAVSQEPPADGSGEFATLAECETVSPTVNIMKGTLP